MACWKVIFPSGIYIGLAWFHFVSDKIVLLRYILNFKCDGKCVNRKGPSYLIRWQHYNQVNITPCSGNLYGVKYDEYEGCNWNELPMAMTMSLQFFIPSEIQTGGGRINHPKWIANNIITNKTQSQDKFGFVSERERVRWGVGIKT